MTLLQLSLVIIGMNSRYFYSNMRDTLAKYRSKTREKRINFMNYLRTQRQKIIEREREKLLKRILFWGIFLGGSFLIYDELYRKKVEFNKMNNKLENFYSAIMVKETLKESLSCVTLSPLTLDELANILSLAYRYHYKVIIRMDQVTKRQKIIISQKFDSKCLFINISALKTLKIDEENSTIYVETGATCVSVNQALQAKGYAPLFPKEFQKQTIYDAITNNLPLNEGELSKYTVSMELVSASGNHFRSAGETNRYGQIPSLNPLFIGTGGVFAIPTAATIRINKQERGLAEENFKLGISNISQKILAIRKFNTLHNEYIQVSATNKYNNTLSDIYVTCKEKLSLAKQSFNACTSLAQKQGIPFEVISKDQPSSSPHYSLHFSINNKIFQEFLLHFGRQLPYEYRNGLLKVAVNQPDNQQKYIQVINEITNNNGALVWCSIPEILLRIKSSLDSSEVGAELMRKIVEVREGMDPRNVLYSHSRYEDYFAKGLFRKLTEYFW